MITEKKTRPTAKPKASTRTRIFGTFAPALVVALLTAQTSANGCAPEPSTSAQDAESAEAEFARYDITESGWLSGTELDACDCRQLDQDGDGEVTKAEFVAGRTDAPAPPAPATPAQQTPPPAAEPQQAAQATDPQPTELAVGAEVEAYISFAWRPATIVQIGGGPFPESPYKVTNGQPINGRQAYMWLAPDGIRAPSRPASAPASGPRVGSYYVMS